MQANSLNVWPMQSFQKMIDRICGEEIEVMKKFGHKPPSDEEYKDMRTMVVSNINAHVVPAGNA